MMEELETSGFEMPAAQTMRRARLRLDVACMLARREESHSAHRLDRYVNFDKSPQTVEILVCVEECVRDLTLSTLEKRLTPLSAMGYQHCGVAHTAYALVHKVFLEAGPKKADVEQWFRSVRSVLTDHSAVESSVAEMTNIIPTYLTSGDPQKAKLVGRLFPQAIRVIGTNHLLDTIMQTVLSSLDFYGNYLSSARALCNFLRPEGHRTALIVSAGGSLTEDPLTTFSANFAKWRWSTLFGVARELTRVRTALCSAWDPRIFQNSKVLKLDELDEAIQNSDFWFWNAAVLLITEFVQSMRGWCQGCKCHGDALQEARQKGIVLRCPAKSRRGPELLVEVGRRRAKLQELRDSLVVEQFGSEQLLHSVRLGLASLEGHLARKFAFVSELPWLLWRVAESREAALECVKSFDEDVAQRGIESCHRVSRLFLEHGGALRSDFEAFANGSLMSERLREELLAYELAPLGETSAAAVHRALTRPPLVGPRAKRAWWACSTRLAQNLEMYDRTCALRGPAHFAHLWQNYKAVLRKPTQFMRRRPLKVPLRDFFDRVYLLGRHSLVDFSWLASSAWSPDGAIRDKAHPCDGLATKREFLSLALQDHCYYSVRYPVGDFSAQETTLEHLVFRVLDKNISRSRVLGSDDRAFVCPMLVQTLVVLKDPAEEDEPSELHVLSEGEVDVVDVLNVTLWEHVWRSLREWSVGVVGALPDLGNRAVRLSNPVHPREKFSDMWNDPYPALLLLRALKAEQWTIVQRPKPHAIDSPKEFSLRKAVSRKNYLRCLLQQRQLAKRGVDCLPHNQSEAYYQVLLASAEPSTVPWGRKASEYKGMLTGHTPGALLDPDEGGITPEGVL